ncbi:MAG: PTS glucose transporter subunit IIB, partial [Mycoplasmataceae bacterium]|nr:PTS glucose transporter subunit IIB [Mycoplasmataceae bacterium]
MTKQEKVMYWFFTIITFGLIHIYWRSKKVAVKSELSHREKITFNIKKLTELLGNMENIDKVES